MIQMLYSEVIVSALGGSPVLILKEASGPRNLAVWISAAAGAAIVSALETDEPGHPATHDLLIAALAATDAVIEAVNIVAENDGVFDAHLIVNDTAVACRVSDGVALALRCGAPIYAGDELLQACTVPPAADADPKTVGDADNQVEQFREFLDQVNPDDFTDGG